LLKELIPDFRFLVMVVSFNKTSNKLKSEIQRGNLIFELNLNVERGKISLLSESRYEGCNDHP